jgi:hypothetical protein
MSTLVTILRPTVQLGMNSWLDFGLWRSRRVGSPTTVAEGYRRRPEANSALSRRKQGFESLASANEIKTLLQDCRLVSNSCPINVYGQAWTTAHQRRPVHRRQHLDVEDRIETEPLGIRVFASSMMRPTAASGSSAAVRKASGRRRWPKLAEWLRPCSPVSRRIGAAG